jgi:acetyl-CoA acetyltransferase
VIVSRADAAPDLRRPPINVEAVGTAIHGRPSWDQWDDLTTMALRDAAAQLWTRTDLTPADVDVAELYDGFSFIALCWLEALGFCGKGEGGPFIDCAQLWGVAGERQVVRPGGRRPEVGVAAAGGGPLAGCLLLTNR